MAFFLSFLDSRQPAGAFLNFSLANAANFFLSLLIILTKFYIIIVYILNCTIKYYCVKYAVKSAVWRTKFAYPAGFRINGGLM